MQPNILYIMVDCLRADVSYGLKGTSRTPSIDALRKRGATFTRMMSVTSTTTPNVATLFTGVYPFRHGVRSLKGYKIAPELPTLAEMLQQVQGYKTYGFISGPIRHDTGLDRGFGLYRAHRHEDGETLFSGWFDRLKASLGEMKPPWFCYIHLWDLHSPRKTLKSMNNRLYGGHLYERSLSSIDERLGELFGILQDNTVITVSGDHGENYRVPLLSYIRNKIAKVPLIGLRPSRKYPKYEHGYGVYDFLINIPFIMAGPNIPEGASYDRLSSQVDMMPTILELAGIPSDRHPRHFHGVSLCPLLRGNSVDNAPVYLEATARNIPSPKDWLKGVRTEDWKFVYAPGNPDLEPLLFDLRNDPEESVNLYYKRPETAEEMRGLILGMESGIETEGMTFAGEEMSEEELARTEEQLRMLGYMD